ncbi:MAG: hypothetical protein HQK54_13115 [Oligoflexales bacterium]|nr:hypothetical protein [Oligoflexales bacterium]
MTGISLSHRISSYQGDFPPIESCIPHKRTMLLLDRINAFHPERNHCMVSSRIRESAPYWDKSNNCFVLHWLVEMMAQSVAVNYFLQVGNSQDKPKNGFLISISKFSVVNPDKRIHHGDLMIFHSTLTNEFFPFGEFYCETASEDNELLASATMKFLIDSEEIMPLREF